MRDGFNLDSTPTKLIMATVCVIILQAFAIPTILAFANGPGLHPGDESDYYATANLPDAEFTFTGSAMAKAEDYHVGDTHIHFKWNEKGTYTLIVTATTSQPEQTAVKTITYDVEGDWSYTSLILVIPTLMIVAVIMFLIRPIRESMRFRKRGGNGGGGDISSGLD